MSASNQKAPNQTGPVDASSTNNPEALESSFVSNVDNPKRRRLLVQGAALMGGLGGVALAVPMLGSMSPSARAKAAGAPVQADLSKLVAGQLLTVEWRGKPVWIVNRSEETLKRLDTKTDRLSDPHSDVEQQPDYAKNPARAIKPEYLVVVGICTHLGCSPSYRPEIAPPDLGEQWDGGFFCPCHGSKFDMSGRVYAGMPAPSNLEVPPYRYVDDQTIIVGEDAGVAA